MSKKKASKKSRSKAAAKRIKLPAALANKIRTALAEGRAYVRSKRKWAGKQGSLFK